MNEELPTRSDLPICVKVLFVMGVIFAILSTNVNVNMTPKTMMQSLIVMIAIFLFLFFNELRIKTEKTVNEKLK